MSTSVYNNLLTTYDFRPTTNQVHDAKELRSVVKRIRKQTQSSPVYLVKSNRLYWESKKLQ